MLSLPYPTIAALRHCAVICCALLLVGCGQRREAASEGMVLAVSIAPLKAIIQPLAPDAQIHVLTPRGASPHTYEPRPSDAAIAADADAVFYVDDTLDGWVTKLDAKKHVRVFDLVPEEMRRSYPEPGDDHGHDHGAVDPHFWMDPQAVGAIIEPLSEALGEMRPSEAEAIKARAIEFAARIGELDAELKETLAPAKGGKVAVFHHAIDYMLARYGIEVAGAVEPSPGQTSGPRTLHELAEHLKAVGAKAVFIEPQLPPQAAMTVAEAAGIPVVEIDPEGGIAGRESYEELLQFNAQAIAGAFR